MTRKVKINDNEFYTVDECGNKSWHRWQGKKTHKRRRYTLLHRLDGPAIESFDGSKFWYVNGKLHREGGPAVEQSNGSKMWFVDGKQHRLDGPSGEWINGHKLWYINGKRYTYKAYIKKVKPLISEKEYYILLLTYG